MGTRIRVTPTPKDQMRVEGLEEVRVFCGPLSFMSTEARSIPPVTSWPPCPAPGLVPLVASGQWEGGCPPLPEACPSQRSPGTPDPRGETDLIDQGLRPPSGPPPKASRVFKKLPQVPAAPCFGVERGWRLQAQLSAWVSEMATWDAPSHRRRGRS